MTKTLHQLLREVYTSKKYLSLTTEGIHDVPVEIFYEFIYEIKYDGIEIKTTDMEKDKLSKYLDYIRKLELEEN